MQRLSDQGLQAYTYTGDDGHPRVHAGLHTITAAGYEISVIRARGAACSFVSEFGAVIGDTRHLGAAVTYVLWLFGLTSRPRP